MAYVAVPVLISDGMYIRVLISGRRESLDGEVLTYGLLQYCK